MASITREPNGCRTIQFVALDGRRPSIRMGRASIKRVEAVRGRVESIVDAIKAGVVFDAELQGWLDGIDDTLHAKLANVRLVPGRGTTVAVTLRAFL